MKTLGFSELILVNPEEFDRAAADVVACHSEDVLDTAQICTSLEEALGDFQDVVGFSGRVGRDRLDHKNLEQWLSQVQANNPGKLALVFGNERTGLSREDLTHCRHLVALPTINAQPSYNLAQAVLLTLFQLRFYALDKNQAPSQEASDGASWEQYNQLAILADELGSSSGFFGDGGSAVVREIFPRILKRIQLSSRECDILMGFCKKLTLKLR